jgi:Cu/Ag efflux protein CusF
MRILLLLVAILSASQWVSAQSRSRSDPADPSAAAPRPAYQPAFSDYQPFRDEPVRSWKEVNKEVADNPATGSMHHKPGATMPGMDHKAGEAPKEKGGTAGHHMGSMKDAPGKTKPRTDAKSGGAAKAKESAGRHDMGAMRHKPGSSNDMTAMAKPQSTPGNSGMGSMKHGSGTTMPGMDSKAGDAAKGKGGAAGHDMGAMHHKPGSAMPGTDKPAATAPKSKDGHDMTAMAKPQSAPGRSEAAATAGIAATGVVQSVDKANAKVKLTHDPIAAMGWPRMTMFFRLKERSLADQVKEGDKVDFTLEKSASGYVISGFRKSISESNPAVATPKAAGHGKH